MTADPNRIRRAIFAKCREAGIGDEERHDVQRRATGKASLKEMSPVEMETVLRALGGARRSRDGVRDSRPGTADLPDGPHTGKLRALWISAYWLGVVRDNEDRALAAWICRQAGIDAAKWATPAQTAACIEALKDWMARDAGVDWSPYARAKGKPKHVPGARVLEALWRKLHEAGAVRIADTGALHGWVVGFRRDTATYTALNASTLNQLIRELGAWLRRAAG